LFFFLCGASIAAATETRRNYLSAAPTRIAMFIAAVGFCGVRVMPCPAFSNRNYLERAEMLGSNVCMGN
jgi:hypothetical protein